MHVYKFLITSDRYNKFSNSNSNQQVPDKQQLPDNGYQISNSYQISGEMHVNCFGFD